MELFALLLITLHLIVFFGDYVVFHKMRGGQDGNHNNTFIKNIRNGRFSVTCCLDHNS